jgi:hypothetical protein
MALTHLAAYLLQIPPEDKQELLTMNSAVELTQRILATYRREIIVLRAMLEHESDSEDGPFSLN